jgi:hypothetical protein
MVLNLRVTQFLSDDTDDRAYRRRLERMIEGDDVAGECDAGRRQPASDPSA